MAQERGTGSRHGDDDIIVTGSRSLSTPDVPTATPVQVLAGDELVHRRQGGLGETLAGLPGVHLDNFGGGASRPVIRGQTVPRIEILSDGANVFDVSSLSPDHAITTDPLLLDGIEVLRGPAATRYGGNAMNGAINLIDSKVPKALPNGSLAGATEVRFGTGDEEKTMVGRVTAGLGSFAVHAEGARRRSGDYHVPDSFGTDILRDSFASTSSYSFGASWISSKGYLGAAYSRFDADYGLPGHSHEGLGCHTHPGGPDGKGYLDCPVVGYDPDRDRTDTASIRLGSTRADIRGDYDDLLSGLAHARLRLSYTDYLHDEIDGGTIFARFTNEVYDGRLELTHAPVFGFTGTWGGQYSRSDFTGLDGYAPSYPRAPNRFLTTMAGMFLNERRSFGAVELEIAARKDWRRTHVPYDHFAYKGRESSARDLAWLAAGMLSQEDLDRSERYNRAAHARRFPSTAVNPFSASISAAWNINDAYSATLQLSRSERAPTVREIYNSANNVATGSREVGLIVGLRGLPTFPDTIETAKAVNLTLRKTRGATQFEIGLFHQDIDNYIFARDIVGTELGSGAVFRYLAYTPADSVFTGIDGQISHQFDAASRITIFGDYVRARMKGRGVADLCVRVGTRKYDCTGGNNNLPRIPPGRLGARYEGNWDAFSADLEYYRTFGQDRIAAFETTTPGYDMLNATLAYRFDIGSGKSVELYARASNLLDELAFVHTSFVKNQSPLRGRNIVLGMRHQFGGAEPGPHLVSRPFVFESAQGPLDWTGVYAGIHAGAGVGRTKGTTTALDGTPDAIAGSEAADRGFSSPLPGLQVGWNHQLASGVVVGAEVDWAKTFFRGTQDATAIEGPFAGGSALAARTAYDVKWTSSLRGRLGYAAGSRFLPYVTGGLALARETQRRDQYRAITLSDEEQYGPTTIAFSQEKVSATRTGFTLGAGAEYALARRLSVKVEYAYDRFGKQSYAFREAGSGVGRDYIRRELEGYDEPLLPPGDPICSEPGAAFMCEPTPIYKETTMAGTSSIINGRRALNNLELHTLKIGLNYRF
ncbi:TonB-dependent receptor [Sphingomonas sp.]|uniref:TonB-dependent receptor domain-containing protein n=1 Tax=Sphingomonas sp. TaxID=28214 RepID=UPI0031E03D3D